MSETIVKIIGILDILMIIYLIIFVTWFMYKIITWR